MKPRRYIVVFAVMMITVVLFSVRLVNLQVAKGSYYREKSDSRTLRSIELMAPRGEILDRNGRAIVSNRTGYNVYILSNRDRKAPVLNRLIDNLSKTVSNADNEVKEVFPIQYKKGKYSFTKSSEEAKLWKKWNEFNEKDSAEKIVNDLIKKYEVDPGYSPQEKLFIVATRFNMLVRGFSQASPYLFMEDVPIEEISVIKEQSEIFSDVTVITQPVRNYPHASLGAHMLGRVGMINSEEYEKNKENGYSINSYIGKSGIEKYMEEYLKGENGAGNVLQNSKGKNLEENINKEPVSGRNVTLTIDLDMQLACEKALEDTIRELNIKAAGIEGGRDADAGSVVVIDVNSGDILAMASYPDYEIETFTENYNDLLENPSKPLFNRSLTGAYSPASTFKILVGTAALEEKIITPSETIVDTGKYTYFGDYQPACWIYNQTGGTHGALNVSEAVRDSCNVFFYDVGRRLGIDKINEYAKRFGLGQKSGIELSDEEETGVVASPENREKNGGIWYPGDVCQTSIGQSDTMLTPLQMANYIATVANGGIRYRPHLIKSVENSDKTSGQETESEVLDKIDISDATREAITKGMRMVVTEGTAQTTFSGCKVPVAAKTGSAQTSSAYTNGICIAYAPYEKPQIAIACVIEKAGSGSNTAGVIRKVVDTYFDNTEESDMKPNVLMK